MHTLDPSVKNMTLEPTVPYTADRIFFRISMFHFNRKIYCLQKTAL